MNTNEIINELKDSVIEALHHCGLESLDPRLKTAQDAIYDAANVAKATLLKRFDLQLQEECPEHVPQVSIPMTVYNGGKLYFAPKGYGDAGSLDGHGSPIGIEIYEGRLRVILWTDINTEDPTIIDMEGARESQRSV